MRRMQFLKKRSEANRERQIESASGQTKRRYERSQGLSITIEKYWVVLTFDTILTS